MFVLLLQLLKQEWMKWFIGEQGTSSVKTSDALMLPMHSSLLIMSDLVS